MLNILRGRPFFAQYAITYRCNSRCPNCEYWRKAAQEEELALDEVARLADELWRFGIRVLTVTGGEPFLRDDALRIIGLFQRRGFRVTINTNGTCIDEGLVRGLARLDKLHIVVSLDSLEREAYARIRGTDSLDAVLAAMSSLKHRTPHEVRAFATVSGLNAAEVPRMLVYCRERGYRLSAYPVMAGNRRRWFTPHGTMSQASKERVAGLFDRLAAMARHDRALFGFSGVYRGAASFLRGKPLGECGAGTLFLQVSPDGKVSACPEGEQFCDIRKERLCQAYKHKPWREGVRECFTDTPCYIGCTRMLQSIRNNPFRFVTETAAKRIIVNPFPEGRGTETASR